MRLYFDTDDDDGSDSGSDDEGGFSSSSERARVKRRLRLDQSVSMTTLRSGLALLQVLLRLTSDLLKWAFAFAVLCMVRCVFRYCGGHKAV